MKYHIKRHREPDGKKEIKVHEVVLTERDKSGVWIDTPDAMLFVLPCGKGIISIDVFSAEEIHLAHGTKAVLEVRTF